MATTITAAEMIRALQALPPEAQLVMTESGYYCYGELAEIQLPEPYTIECIGYQEHGIPEGTVVYTIGHSHQSY
jgi:hypothetical protein